jgi:hypothetical protein
MFIKANWSTWLENAQGYWIAPGHFLKGIGKQLGMPITLILVGKMFLLAGCDKKKFCERCLSANKRQGRIAQ